MASLSAVHKNPRPWHTRSFYMARLMLFCVAVLAFSESLPGGFLTGFSIALFHDAAAIWVLAKGQIQLPAPLTDNTFASQHEKEALKLCAAYCVIGFAAVSLGVLFASGMVEPSNFVFRLIAIASLNISGWHYMRWFREVAALFRQYNPPTITATSNVAANAAPQPIISVYKPITPQATPQVMCVGKSA